MLLEAVSQPDMGENDEAALVAGLRAFENDAWALLYDRHHTQIWRYVLVRTGSRDLADDIAAQVFAEAVASIHRFQPRGRPILAWLYRIARNLASKQARRRGREGAAGAVEPAAASGGAPEERLDALVLSEALTHLTRDQREVVSLRFFAGLSTREIATVLGKREAAVYSLEVRALAALRRRLQPESQKLPGQADKDEGSAGIGISK